MEIKLGTHTTEILINPRLPISDLKKITDKLLQFNLEEHVWFATSGSTAKATQLGKWVALSKKAIRASARAVNAHLNCTQKDVWLNPLPFFHVGGMGIVARAELAGAEVIDFPSTCPKWNAMKCYQTLIGSRATLTALVPAQLYDFVCMELVAPTMLRAVVIGGGALPPALYFKAVALGWNVLPSYGLTECGSQVATALLDSISHTIFPKLHVLGHFKSTISDKGLICLAGESLLTAYSIYVGRGLQLIDPKVDDWFETEDRGELIGGSLYVHGRTEGFIKIGGESVEMKRLETIIEGLKLTYKIDIDIALLAYPEERLGHVIHLMVTKKEKMIDVLVAAYNSLVLPFERIRQLNVVNEIPRTSLNKLRREVALDLIKSDSALA